MTPLLGTKTPSAPVGDKSGGDRRAARSLLSCALWRCMGRLWCGMGGMGRPEPLSVHRPHQQQRLSGFHETRDTNHGFCRGAAWGGCGAAWAAAVPRSATPPVGFSPATNHETCFPPALRRLQEEQLQARPTGFSRITRHESRLFFESRLVIRFDALPTSAHHCPLLPGIARQKNIVPASVRASSGVLVGPHGWPACLTTRRGEVGERAVRIRREPGGGKRRVQV